MHDDRARANDALVTDGDAVADRRVHPQEAPSADRHIPRYHHLRGDERALHHGRVVPDVVPTPQVAVVPDGHERLDRIVLQHKAVPPDPFRHPDRCPGTQVRRKFVPESQCVAEPLDPKPVEL